MIPIKAVSLIPIVAKKLNLPEDEVRKIINFYYKNLKDKLVNMEFTSFVLESFGKIHIKEVALDNLENDLNLKINSKSSKEQTPKIEADIRMHREDLIRVKNLKEELALARQKKEFVSLYKQTYKDEKIKKDLERQISNSQGDSELGIQATQNRETCPGEKGDLQVK